MLRVAVTDNGVGGARIAAGSGLAGLRDRLDALDATLAVDSAAGTGNNRPRRAPMRVVIADDAPLIREGVARLLTENGVEVVAQVGDAEALLARVRDLRPDVAIVDVRMPPTHTDEGLRAAHEIRSRYPETAVLVLSQHLEPEYALRLIDEKTGTGRIPDEGTGGTSRGVARRVGTGRRGRVRRGQGHRRGAPRATTPGGTRSTGSRRASARSSP